MSRQSRYSFRNKRRSYSRFRRGTTGISILNGSKIIFTADEPTGGSHMTLTIAGYYNIDFDEAEKIKNRYEERKRSFCYN